MFQNQKILAFVGARAGSKGLPNKNLLPLKNKPLVVWTIEAGLASQYVDQTILSTDGSKIAEVGRQFGAYVPFLRPDHLAGDQINIDEAIRYTLDRLKVEHHEIYDFVLRLQPTTPLRNAKHIDAAIEHYFQTRKTPEDTLVSVVPVEHQYGWIMHEDRDGYIHFSISQELISQQRQGLPSLYIPNGAIYMAPVSVVMANGFYTDNTIPFVMSPEVSLDIDSKEDLENVARRI